MFADRDHSEGDQKFAPDVMAEALRKIADISPKTKAGRDKIIDPLLAVPPFSLGYPNKNPRPVYYISNEIIVQDEIAKVMEVMYQSQLTGKTFEFEKCSRLTSPCCSCYKLLRKLILSRMVTKNV